MMQNRIKEGLRPRTRDDRDLTLGAIIDVPKPQDVPDFFLDGGWANNHIQEEDDCSAFMVAIMRELRENVELDREFQFAAMKSITGDPEQFGGELRDAFKTAVKIGMLPLSERPLSCVGKPLSFLRYLSNWDNFTALLKIAWMRRAKSYVWIEPTQGMDAFDSIAGTQYFWLKKGEKRAVGFGTYWNWSLTDYIIRGAPTSGMGHAMAYRGKITIDGEKYLIVQQNYGAEAGKLGLHAFSRETVNNAQEIYGAGMFTSYTPDELRTMIANGYSIDKESYFPMLKNLLSFILDLLAQLKQKTYGIFTR